jgi:transcriptional regulator with XRE-family HTH domain
MNSIGELLDRAKERAGVPSDNQLASALGVKRQTVSNWRQGHNTPDAVACEKLAEITGEPLARVLGIAGEARALSREEKAVWRRLATAAAVVLATGAAAYGIDFSAAPEATYALAVVYIIRTSRDCHKRPP